MIHPMRDQIKGKRQRGDAGKSLAVDCWNRYQGRVIWLCLFFMGSVRCYYLMSTIFAGWDTYL